MADGRTQAGPVHRDGKHPSRGGRMSSRIRVGLVDDQALFRAGIRMLVSSQRDLEFVGEGGNGVEGIAMAAASRPDVVLIDIRMLVVDGIDCTRAVMAAAAGLRGL